MCSGESRIAAGGVRRCRGGAWSTQAISGRISGSPAALYLAAAGVAVAFWGSFDAVDLPGAGILPLAATLATAATVIWIAGLLYMPVALFFFFIGTALWAFYRALPHRLPAGTAPV